MENELENEMEYEPEGEAQAKPAWVLRGGYVNEGLFCREFLEKHKLAVVDGAFFTIYGRVIDNAVRQDIYREVSPYIHTNLARKVDNLFNALRMTNAYVQVDCSEDRIHVGNGVVHLDTGRFVQEKQYCRHRLPLWFSHETPLPERWLSFLDELLYPEDILTLQQFMGYCLVPSTRAQKMLLIIGEGGEGKSRIGTVMHALLGKAMCTGSLAKVEQNPFARADLEHRLLMVDDDLKLEALAQTNHIKSIISAELPMDLERKGVQSYQAKLYTRFMAFGNGSLQALHDRSYGFFRRQIILTTKPRPRDRVDDPFLTEKLVEEINGIFLWALVGLGYLREKNYMFHISQRAQENLRLSMAQGNNILEFMESEGYIRNDLQGSVSTRSLYNIYRDWCDDNAMLPLSMKSFSSFLIQNQDKFKIEHSNSVAIGGGRYVRGFRGLRILPRACVNSGWSKHA